MRRWSARCSIRGKELAIERLLPNSSKPLDLVDYRLIECSCRSRQHKGRSKAAGLANRCCIAMVVVSGLAVLRRQAKDRKCAIRENVLGDLVKRDRRDCDHRRLVSKTNKQQSKRAYNAHHAIFCKAELLNHDVPGTVPAITRTLLPRMYSFNATNSPCGVLSDDTSLPRSSAQACDLRRSFGNDTVWRLCLSFVGKSAFGESLQEAIRLAYRYVADQRSRCRALSVVSSAASSRVQSTRSRD